MNSLMLPPGGLAIVSGLALAWTQNAKFRPDWVRAKLPITLTLAEALVAVVAPGLADEAVRARVGATGGNPAYAVGPVVSAALLVVTSYWELGCRQGCSVAAQRVGRVRGDGGASR